MKHRDVRVSMFLYKLEYNSINTNEIDKFMV